jgi:fibronectin-binding autotransporter adhesin
MKMTMSRRSRLRLCVALTAGLSWSIARVELAHAQQNLNDPTVLLNANDSTGVSSFSGGPTFQWAASSDGVLSVGTAPTSGYAYVVTGSASGTGQLRTGNTSTGVTFAGDSLTIIPYNGQANLYNTSASIVNPFDMTAGLFLYGNTSGQLINVPSLELANGGAVVNAGKKYSVLAGDIYLAPTGTLLDGITTTLSGGIIDEVSGASGLIISATLSGSGQLHIVSSGGSSATYASLNASNGSFSGGIFLDNTVGSTSAGSGNYPLLNINTPTALGTGTFTIGSYNASGTTVGSGPTIDNTSGAPETLTTNNVQQWNGSFQFKGTNPLNLGSGNVTLGSPVSLTLTNSVLTETGAISGPYTLNLTGSGTLEVMQPASITTSAVNVSNGTTLAYAGATSTPAQIAAAPNSVNFISGSYLGIDTTGASQGVYNLTANLPGGVYGVKALGTGTLVLSGSNSYSGITFVGQGTLIPGSINALGTSGVLSVGSNSAGPDGTFDLNGTNQTLNIVGGAYSGLVTNSNISSPSTLTLLPPQTSTQGLTGGGSYFGQIAGNLSVIVNNPATSVVTLGIGPGFNGYNNANSYTGATLLESGVLAVSTSAELPATHQVYMTGGTLELSNNSTYQPQIDPSASFAIAPNQQFNILSGSTYTNTFYSSLNSSGGSLTFGVLAVSTTNGTLVLAAPNYYTGPTTVNAGTLIIANSQALAGTSQVVVNSTNTGTVFAPSYANGGLAINNSSGLVGLSGAVVGGVPIILLLNGLGGDASISYTHFVAGHAVNTVDGYAYFGALQGTAGGAAVWAGTVSLNSSSGAPVGISGGYNNATTGGTLTIAGTISGTGPVMLGLNANSVTVLGASNSYSGETQLMSSTGVTSTVQLGANSAIPADSGLNFTNNNAELQSNASFVYGPTIFDLHGFNTSTAYFTSTSTATLSTTTQNANSNNGVITNLQNNSTSVLTILGSASEPYLGQFKDGSATAKLGLAFDVSGVFDFTGGNNYSGGTTVNSGNLVIPGLSNAGSGNLTINGGEMVIQAPTTATAAAIYGLLRTGYNGGNWNGSGVNSVTAASDTSHLTAVGMLTGSTENFEGQLLNATDVALKLTYYGDTNLDGQVDGSDYSLVDYAYLNNLNTSNPALTGWQNGDFNYDGVVDGSDYTLMDNAFNSQGAQFSNQLARPTASISAGAPVPEPASLALLSIGLTALLGRPRRH